MGPEKKQRIQTRLSIGMYLTVVLGLLCILYATFNKCSWKTNLAALCGVALIVVCAILKLIFDRNEVKFYNN